jgi:hypothetical protein
METQHLEHEHDRNTLLELERGFWLGDLDFYRANLAMKAMMIFPDPIGVMTRSQILESMEKSPRWNHVAMEDVRVLELDIDFVILTYRASATRSKQQFSYSVLAGSLYVRKENGWKLAFHQHTPILKE